MRKKQTADSGGTRLRFGNTGRFVLTVWLFALLLLLGLGLNVHIGSVAISSGEVLRLIWNGLRYGLASVFTRGETHARFLAALEGVTHASTREPDPVLHPHPPHAARRRAGRRPSPSPATCCRSSSATPSPAL
jgi:hypothetical protein